MGIQTDDLAAAISSGTLGVELRDVSKSYGDVVAVSEVSLKVDSGHFFSLLGPSGSGKSTILRLIGGFEECDSGAVLVAGRDVTRVPPFRRPTAMVFQRWALFPHLTVFDNVAFGLQLRRMSSDVVRKRVNDLLELVGLAGLGGRKSTQLSGGQQQRVALARALAIQPKVLLLDEPLSSLDLKLRVQMQLELKRLQREVGTTFVYVTHDQSEAMVMSEVVAVVDKGRIHQVGPPREIYDHPSTKFVAQFIGDANLLRATVKRGSGGVVLCIGNREFAPPPEMDWPNGSELTVSLRYERVLVDPALESINSFPARIRDVIFAGAFIRYSVISESGDIELVSEVPNDGSAQVLLQDAPVHAGWRPDSAVVVPG
ncbi:MAG TPA: spermidine/putrescine ABC transporter ATP-binding protein [Chloroflexi bacterium]|jgi:ABC-type Fe3+/spermidine/putrescine transport system ATPase subunit|nr:spermidine/putrescine ABC transporter ATP-binding protein [Chloroflexota bacterium]